MRPPRNRGNSLRRCVLRQETLRQHGRKLGKFCGLKVERAEVKESDLPLRRPIKAAAPALHRCDIDRYRTILQRLIN